VKGSLLYVGTPPSFGLEIAEVIGRTQERPTVIDVFAGCGGGTFGFKEAGYEVRAAVEIDAVACQSYRLNHSEVNLLEQDVRRLNAAQILEAANLKAGETTVLLGCPPCQGFSTLSTVGGEDSRNSLVWRFAALAVDIAPEFVVFENVPGLKNGRGKLRWARAKGLLQRAGYHLVEDIVDAVSFGIPQFRRRLLLLASRNDDRSLAMPEATHASLRIAQSDGLIPWATVRDAIGSLPPIAPGQADNDQLHKATRHNKVALERLRHIPQDGGGRRSLPQHLVLNCHKRCSGHWDVYGRMWWDRPSPTLTSGCTNVTRGRFAHPDEDRAITLREAARLQTFPDSYQFAGSKGEMANQIGNAVPPLLAMVIARHVLKTRQKQKESL
jgi:DNA (cytosine-5)-methyltransferase 1